MILGEPTFQAILEYIEEEGCPLCGEPVQGMDINGPSEIILGGCGHVFDAEPWIDPNLDPTT